MSYPLSSNAASTVLTMMEAAFGRNLWASPTLERSSHIQIRFPARFAERAMSPRIL
jgi:hypothetical protein